MSFRVFRGLYAVKFFRNGRDWAGAKVGGQKGPRHLMATHLAGFASETGIEPRTVRAQLLELCGKVAGAIGSLADTFRKAGQRPLIVEEIIRVVEQRLRKSHSLIA